jgi:hypothetical protein
MRRFVVLLFAVLAALRQRRVGQPRRDGTEPMLCRLGTDER